MSVCAKLSLAGEPGTHTAIVSELFNGNWSGSSSTVIDYHGRFPNLEVQEQEDDYRVYLLEILFIILGCLAMPLSWTETLLFWMPAIPTSTSFRMFPRADTVPDHPTIIAHSFVLIAIMCIPNFGS